MRQNSFLRSFTLAFLAVFSLNTSKIVGMCGTTVLWNNLSDTDCGAGSNPGVTASVVDQNINVSGINALVGGITIAANTCNVNVNVVADAVITGSANLCDGTPAGEPRLYLYAAPGQTITFNIDNDLTFAGVNDQGTPLDLLITASGQGNIIFNIAEGQTVSLTSTEVGGGGAQFYIATNDAGQLVQFVQASTGVSGPTQVVIGPNSRIGFLADPASINPSATLTFSSLVANQQQRLQLNIQTGGALDTTVFVGDLTLGSTFLLSDIDLTDVDDEATVGLNFNLAGAATLAAVTVINANSVYPTDLLSDPFCQGVTAAPAALAAGFRLTAPATLAVASNTYFDYIGTATNVCVTFTILDACGQVQEISRLRNGSAFIVDSPSDDINATITLAENSAIYFRSGVDSCGSVSVDFTVNSSVITPCTGNIVLDVEGPLAINGFDPDTTGVEILSLEVVPSGCPVTVDSTLAPLFPARTFDHEGGDPDAPYIQYNLAAFLVNNVLTFNNTSLIHTDTIHKVWEHFNLGNPNLFSEPTYVGGDSYTFTCHADRGRPAMEFIDSKLRLHSSAAVMGVDLSFPNVEIVEGDSINTSSLIFYNNGRCIDDGYGRNLILGTEVCSAGCVPTNDLDAHLNVQQTDAQETVGAINLWILTGQNTECITEGIPSQAAIAGQNAIQTIFLNNASNFSIGSIPSDVTFPLTIPANVNLDGASLSFETRGGTLAFPQSSGTTGEGGIFVDFLGSLNLLNNRLANFGTMVTKSNGGVVNLPSNQAFFAPRVGIAEWQPDMTDPDQRILVLPGQTLSDYTLDWGSVVQDYCCFNELPPSPFCFIPYNVEELPAPCAAPAVTQNNLFNIPTIQGNVEQMQILRSRMNDFVHLLVDGGNIGELVFLKGYNSAEGPFGFIVLQNDGVVGLGSAHRNVDSLEASIQLGVNGVMLVANGNGNVQLNEDVIINNVCHILTGTSFSSAKLEIGSSQPRELRIKSTGVLDLTQFTDATQILEITGFVTLVCEPGARILMNGGILQFSDNARFVTESLFDSQVNALSGVDVNSTDTVRVKLSGTGIIVMGENSSMSVEENSFFGIETYPACSDVTDILWVLTEQASIQIGNDAQPGGAFQIGDTVVTSTAQSISVRFEMNGEGSLIELNRQGFIGLASGVVSKPANSVPNDWTIGCLSNLTTFSLIMGGGPGVGNTAGGTFSHNQIAPGNFEEASLLAIGSVGNYTVILNPANTVGLGGGNMVKVNCDAVVGTSVIPTVTTFAGLSDDGALETGILSGKLLLADTSKGPFPVGVTAQELFDYLKTSEYDTQNSPRANISSNGLNLFTLGYVDNAIIQRPNVLQIFAKLGVIADADHSLEIGAVWINLDPVSRGLITIQEIRGTGSF